MIDASTKPQATVTYQRKSFRLTQHIDLHVWLAEVFILDVLPDTLKKHSAGVLQTFAVQEQLCEAQYKKH